MLLYYTKRGEQYFREEYINVTENVAVNRYCSLCVATYTVARWIILYTYVLRNKICSFFGFFNTLAVFILIFITRILFLF